MENGSQNKGIDWSGVVQQIYDMIGTDVAIIDRYGIVLASKIPSFSKGRLISPTIFDVMMKRQKIQRELEVEDLDALVLETNTGNFVFTFGKYIYLMSIIPKNVDLSQFMPSISRIISTLDRSTDKNIDFDFSSLELQDEFKKLSHEDEEELRDDPFPVFKHLIKHMAKKK